MPTTQPNDEIDKLIKTLCHKFEDPKQDSFNAQIEAREAIQRLIVRSNIETLKGAKDVLGIDRTNPGVTEDFNAGVEQITYVVNATLQGNIDRLEATLNTQQDRD